MLERMIVKHWMALTVGFVLLSLTKEEIRALCEEAADKAVERSEKARKKSIAQEKKTLLYNTKKLLENYTKLKDYAEKAVCTIDEAEQVDESMET